MKAKKKQTKMIIVSPQDLRLLRLGLAERMKVRRRKEDECRERYHK
jgi:hypothetical protein